MSSWNSILKKKLEPGIWADYGFAYDKASHRAFRGPARKREQI